MMNEKEQRNKESTKQHCQFESFFAAFNTDAPFLWRATTAASPPIGWFPHRQSASEEAELKASSCSVFFFSWPQMWAQQDGSSPQKSRRVCFAIDEPPPRPEVNNASVRFNFINSA